MLAPRLRDPWKTLTPIANINTASTFYSDVIPLIGPWSNMGFPSCGVVVHLVVTGAVATNLNVGVFCCRDGDVANSQTIANSTRLLTCTGLATFIDEYTVTWDIGCDFFRLGFTRVSAVDGKAVAMAVRPIRVETS